LHRLFVLALLMAPLTHAAQEDDLAYYLPPHEVVWLGTNENTEESSETRYLMLYKEGETSFSRGVALTLPNWGTHPLQQTYPALLYRQLPFYGWESFALHAPTRSLLNFNWDQENQTPYPDPVSAEALGELKDLLLARVQLAFEHIGEAQGFRLIIAEGLTAALLVDLIEAGEIARADALILISPYYPQWQLNRELSEKIAQLRIPVLDIQQQDAIHWSVEEAARRQQQARKFQHTGYRQRTLNRASNRQNHALIEQIIYGWLNYEGF